MLLRTPIYLPDKLVAKAREVAAARGATLTALIIEQLEALTESKADDSIVMYSRGLLTKEQAIEYSGFRDYAELLVAMGDADLPLPALSKSEIDEQVKIFTEIWEKD
ncbi:hypothetical protein [Methylobacter svalbardensis]|uniref:hypothetical protein n=1 Tax=Methylobacter svalbardensis TaxID=3080016 RepID=UPI0030EB2623